MGPNLRSSGTPPPVDLRMNRLSPSSPSRALALCLPIENSGWAYFEFILSPGPPRGPLINEIDRLKTRSLSA